MGLSNITKIWLAEEEKKKESEKSSSMWDWLDIQKHNGSWNDFDLSSEDFTSLN